MLSSLGPRGWAQEQSGAAWVKAAPRRDVSRPTARPLSSHLRCGGPVSAGERQTQRQGLPCFGCKAFKTTCRGQILFLSVLLVKTKMSGIGNISSTCPLFALSLLKYTPPTPGVKNTSKKLINKTKIPSHLHLPFAFCPSFFWSFLLLSTTDFDGWRAGSGKARV